jgi:hypothetical protein
VNIPFSLYFAILPHCPQFTYLQHVHSLFGGKDDAVLRLFPDTESMRESRRREAGFSTLFRSLGSNFEGFLPMYYINGKYNCSTHHYSLFCSVPKLRATALSYIFIAILVSLLNSREKLISS